METWCVGFGGITVNILVLLLVSSFIQGREDVWVWKVVVDDTLSV